MKRRREMSKVAWVNRINKVCGLTLLVLAAIGFVFLLLSETVSTNLLIAVIGGTGLGLYMLHASKS